ncbi:LCP family protein [Clostridium vincentii]|uniref:Transcriptional regulator LytR n=1 Tax=Clostridium vincentii TaxID=52704 RepID=A0A2T0BGV8_9CLOT|nr:LCP family protein [Clostridium vincentii]PRR83067.1 Transcriptional regulator LytR [Clostridium vincentii]
MNRTKKLSPFKKILIGIISLILILSVVGYSYIYTTLSKVNTIEIDLNDLEIKPHLTANVVVAEIRNIAIFGIDSLEGEIGRSDSIMILTIDEKNNKLKVSSIIRDSYVEIPGREGKDKINHAYAFGTASGDNNGGPTLAIKTLNRNFNLNIQDFVSVNFSSLPKLIDSVGGIKINISSEEMTILNLASAGNQTLDGAQALAYSRIRYAEGGDFVRSDRQRNVISALFSKFKSASITSYPSLLKNLLPLLDTNLNPTDILALATKINSLPISQLDQDRFPRDDYGEGRLIDGIYYYVFDIEETAKQMTDYIFLDR